MRRLGLVVGMVAMLVLADGVYQSLSHYRPQDQNQVWNSSLTLSDGTTLIISAIALALLAGLMWWAGRREERRRKASRSGTAAARR